MLTIALDAMGGDHAPAATVAGAVLAAKELKTEIELLYNLIDIIGQTDKLDMMVAQMTSEEKNAISHRGNAIREIKLQLEELLMKY